MSKIKELRLQAQIAVREANELERAEQAACPHPLKALKFYDAGVRYSTMCVTTYTIRIECGDCGAQLQNHLQIRD